MKHVVLPEGEVQRLSFYLAEEEYLARQYSADDLLLLWQVRPTVIIGRNQVIEREVDLNYCREHGIEVYRRKSGGGCVYADMGCLMFSLVTSSQEVNLTFNRFVCMMMLVLRKAGVEATATRHNDIMLPPVQGDLQSPTPVQGDLQSPYGAWRKVCGTAFFRLPRASIVHGTLLYDTTMEHINRAITPSAEKLAKHGVDSVRQRVGLLKDYTTLSLEELKDMARQTLCDGERRLTQADVEAIREIELTYLDEDFIMGRRKNNENTKP